MDFRIKEIILWPKNRDNEIRRIVFKENMVNVITGDSERGKSACISIVDYCLSSSKCQIPTGMIRKKTEWFGVLFKQGESEILLARREPGDSQSSSEMFMLEGKNITVPNEISAKNCSSENVKYRLDELASLSDLGFSESEDNIGFKTRPSFRDMVSFLFQPQYIVANPRTMFYKSDTFEHREKLKTIFPYVLGAINNDILKAREELRELFAREKVLSRQDEISERALNKWFVEIKSYYTKAQEFGLLNNMPDPTPDWNAEKYVSILKKIPPAVDSKGLPQLLGTTLKITDKINSLRNSEISEAERLQELRTRVIMIKKIGSSNNEYTDSILTQNDRLASIGWFSKKLKDKKECPLCKSTENQNRDYLNEILKTKISIEEQAVKSIEIKKVFNKEITRIEKEIREKEDQINCIRTELKLIEKTDEKYGKSNQSSNSVYRFIGELEAKLKDFDSLYKEERLTVELIELKSKINDLKSKIDEVKIRERLHTSLRKIQSLIEHYSKIFKAERSNDPINLDLTNLTISFSKDSRSDYLWEIGSGSNYMAYHVSTMLAIHELLLRKKIKAVPNFLFFDQPSQAYFPELGGKLKENLESDDIERVQRIFQAFTNAIERTTGNLQIIVLEHAGTKIWENMDNVHLVARWRDDENNNENALIPKSWINE